MVTMIGSMPWGPAQIAVALAGLGQSALRNNQPLGPWSPLDVKSPTLDFALPPLEVVWHGVPLGESVFSLIALLPLLLKFLPSLPL